MAAVHPDRVCGFGHQGQIQRLGPEGQERGKGSPDEALGQQGTEQAVTWRVTLAGFFDCEIRFQAFRHTPRFTNAQPFVREVTRILICFTLCPGPEALEGTLTQSDFLMRRNHDPIMPEQVEGALNFALDFI